MAALTQVTVPFAGTVVRVAVAPGDLVTAGVELVVLESMKMEHVVEAATPGRIDSVAVAPGDAVQTGDVLLSLMESDEPVVATDESRDAPAPAEIRPELAELRARLEATRDTGRFEATERRHAGGRRTARENIDDLCDSGTFEEYGGLVIAAQRARRTRADLVANTPADGLIAGIGRVNGGRCAVLSYDYSVLAGTQGQMNHKKKDRLFELAERLRLPVVLFAEGGGGRPGDTDMAVVTGLDTEAFARFGALSGLVPLVGVVSGRCFAGNAALLGCCHVIIATPDANIGMGGPAMIEGGGLGVFTPEEVGPAPTQVSNGVVDVLCADEKEAVEVARQYLAYFQGDATSWTAADQELLREVVPSDRRRVYDVRRALELLADEGSVLELRASFSPGMVTALARVEGRTMGVIANNPLHGAGAIDAGCADKAARFMQLCEAFGLPMLSLCDTPGFMVGPEAEETALVRHVSRMFVVGSSLTVPLACVVLRKGYGLGAQAMAGGSFHRPVFTVAWPTGELGGMGLEGAVRLGFRRELDLIDDPEEREAAFSAMVFRAYEHGKALHVAEHFEIDDVIDPAATRARFVHALDAAGPRTSPEGGAAPVRRHVVTDIERLVGAMSLDEKCSLTAGASMWYLPPVERLGIGALKVSDGPSGVRGDSLIGRRSLSLPCGMAVGSTWNPVLVERLGEVLAAEARSKGVHVLLGPTVCIPRTPLAGRTFESFSEDPLLTARLAVAYVKGVQGAGVACCIKHYACNDQEHERMTISAEVSERTLREIHLVAFEQAVREAGVWSVMTAYNKVNGTYCGEQPDLINGILRGEWRFDGLVMSDWFGTHSTAPAVRAGLDLEMPGPPAWFGPSLAAAVRDGLVDETVVDDQVRHVLRLMDRVGVLDGTAPVRSEEQEQDDPGRRAVARAVAAEGTVLLVNDGLLPLGPAGVSSVAVIGPNAGQLAMGGGSSEVTPHRRRSVADALAERLPDATIRSEVGCRIDRGLPAIDLRLVNGEQFMVEYFDNAGPPATTGAAAVAAELAHTARILWIGPPQPGLEVGRCAVRIRGIFTPDVSGRWRLGLESAGRSVLRIDGVVVVDNSEPERGEGFYGAGSQLVEAEHPFEAGRSYELAVDVWPRSTSSPILGVRIGAARPDLGDEFERAVAAAGSADVALVVVGSNGQWESEGHDRPDLSLPGRQRELVEAVIAANSRTVVVVNAGSPVEMPWAGGAAAVLMTWYPGEEGADALADILVGTAEPTGRLPVTFPVRVEDGPTGGSRARYPGTDGTVRYEEGVLVGYRHYETAGVAPLFAFGHGLSYGAIVYDQVEITSESVTVRLTNEGVRRGTEVVQVYLRALDPRVTRPDRELVGFVKVGVEAGQQESVEVELTAAAFRYWDVGTHAWRADAGSYEVLVGSSSCDIRASAVIAWADVSA